jgi:hypothetical protein
MKILFTTVFVIISCYLSMGQVTPMPLDLGSYNGTPLYINPVSADTIWAGISGVNDFTWVNIKTYAKSFNGGTSWTMDTVPDPLDRGILEFFALNASVAWAVTGDYYGAITALALFNTTDGGATWNSNLDTAFNAGFFLNSIYFFSPDSGVAMGDPRNGYFEIYNTSDAGVTWSRVPQGNIPAPLPMEIGITHCYSAYGNKIWFSSNIDGRIFYSVDRGYTWSVSTVMPGGNFAGVAFSDSINGIAWKNNNVNVITEVYSSNDGGNTWITQPVTPPAIMYQVGEIKNYPGSFLFTADVPAKLFATTDNFASYYLIDDTHSFANPPYWSPIKMYNASIGWVADQPMSDSSIYKLQNILSGIEEQSESALINSFNIFPNPVTSGATLCSFTVMQNAEATLTLFDLAGKKLDQQIMQSKKGGNACIFPFNNIAAGYYILNLKVADESLNLKVIVK